MLKFQSWQAILRYGAMLEAPRDRRGLENLLGFALGLDIVASLAAIGAALAFLPLARDLFEWPEAVAEFAPWFLICIPFIMQATPNGALRLFDRVDVLAAQHALNAVFRLVGVGAAVALDGGALHIAAAWFTASVLSGAWVFAVFAREMRRRRLRPRFETPWLRAGTRFPGVWRFLLLTNAASTVQLSVSHLTTMLVGARLGAEAAGAFEIARQFAASIAKPARVLGPLVLPDLSRLTARGEWQALARFLVRQLWTTALAALIFAAVLFAVLDPLVAHVYGPEMARHAPLFQLLTAGALIGALGFALEPAYLAANRAGSALAIQSAAAALYLPLALLLADRSGVTGVGVAILAHAALYHGALGVAGRSMLGKAQGVAGVDT
ncbi:lipopolysaccharide biosynthesis protein [Albimonas pacifica]|uniref:Polysaccharide biosynthesis protein n=1 Tax=Albimonas pacifica TaxID=1114924 RepID=A0A1I3BPT8_9RHOB|nr:oligosaccharide flippase family protein [Albimonas pacifica]SFH64190.1 Polysaccharide biosynthesis protein [Albimonas pacifica]